jgi:predicted dehydrogenase
MSPVVRIALIGCGSIAERHIRWLLEVPEVQITRLCDRSLDAAAQRLELVRELAPGVEVSAQSEYSAVLADPEVDGVVVLLPHHLHYPVTKAALEAGKHVLVEKPMVTRSVHARDLIATARETGRLLGIAYQRATLPEYAAVRGMVERGELGRVRFVSAHLEQSWYRRAVHGAGQGGWRHDPALAGGGQLVDTGSHTVAAMLDVSGLVPEEVFAYVDRCGLEVDVNTAMSIRFTGGALGTVMIGGFGHSVTEVLRIVGDEGSARIFFRTVREQSLEVNGALVDAAALVPRSNPDADFVEAILGRAQLAAPAELGLAVAELSEAAYRSAAEGRPIPLTQAAG